MSESLDDIQMDGANLYREDVFSDRRVGTIQRLTPVTANGDEDPSRPVRFLGQASLMTPGGSLPISFEIEADSLEAAIDQFGARAGEAVQDTLNQLQEMRREAASGLVIPGQGGPGGGMGGAPGGGFGGPGGGIQLP
jgi:hypothetical protein